jgi:hypothetical protein
MRAGRCGFCRVGFTVTLENSPAGRPHAILTCPTCARTAAIPLSRSDIQALNERERRMPPLVDPSRFVAMREVPVRPRQWRLYQRAETERPKLWGEKGGNDGQA